MVTEDLFYQKSRRGVWSGFHEVPSIPKDGCILADCYNIPSSARATYEETPSEIIKTDQ